MRIDNHIFQTLLIGSIFIPTLVIILNHFYFNLSSFLLFILIGLFCGSLYPDTDCPKSRIFKMKQDRRKIGWQKSYKEYQYRKNLRNYHNIFLFFYSSILIMLGLFFRLLIYYPSYWIIFLINKRYINRYKVANEHRGISHTIFGSAIASGIFFLLFFLTNLQFRYTNNYYLILSTLTFFLGCVIHLMQDSISVSGIRWFHPFKQTCVCGNYSAFTDDSRIAFLNCSLFAALIINLSAWHHITITNVFFAASLLFILALISIILIFFIMFRNCEVKILRL